MGDGDESLLGQFPQCAHVGPHVQLAAHQNHFGVGAELLRLTLPLQEREGNEQVSQKKRIGCVVGWFDPCRLPYFVYFEYVWCDASLNQWWVS